MDGVGNGRNGLFALTSVRLKPQIPKILITVKSKNLVKVTFILTRNGTSCLVWWCLMISAICSTPVLFWGTYYCVLCLCVRVRHKLSFGVSGIF